MCGGRGQRRGRLLFRCEKVDGRQRVLKHFGSAHNEFEVDLLLRSAREGRYGAPVVVGSASRFLWDVLVWAYENLGFTAVGDKAFMQMVLAKLVEPTSIRATERVVEQLGVASFSLPTFYRCSKRIVERSYKDVVCKVAFRFATKDSRLSLALFDATTLHFESDVEKGLRKVGKRKEGGYTPLVQVGLLTEDQGFPLEFSLFAGNVGETK